MNMSKNTMKVLVLVVAAIFTSCNKIPNTTIGVELSQKDLANAIEYDSTFGLVYRSIRSTYDNMDKVEQAQYFNITYRDVYKCIEFINDSNYWNPLYERWNIAWMVKYGPKMQQADSVIQYWKKHKEDNLEKCVDIELARVWTEYYKYIGGISSVNLGFRLTPLKGKIDQLKFKYVFTPKVSERKGRVYNDNADSIEVIVDAFIDSITNIHKCTYTSPFSIPVVGYWTAGYTDEKRFGGMTAEQVLRNYNLKIEIIEIQCGGRIINEETLGIPKSVIDYLKPGLYEKQKDDVVREVIDKDFKADYEYIEEEFDKICTKKYGTCNKFRKKMFDNFIHNIAS